MLSRAIADFSFFSLSMLTHWVFPKCRLHLEFLVVIPRGSHPFPSRTRKLSPAGPMILHGQLCGNVGRRQDKNKRPKQPKTASAFFVFTQKSIWPGCAIYFRQPSRFLSCAEPGRTLPFNSWQFSTLRFC